MMTHHMMFMTGLLNLPRPIVASDIEVLRFIDRQQLAGTGIGYIDAHLLASVRLTPGASFWTRDNRLCGAAEKLELAVRLHR